MAGEHALTSRVIAWTIATQARLGKVEQARAALAALDDRQAAAGEIRNAAAVIRLAEQDPAGARRELRAVLDGSAPVNPCLTLVEAHLLDALACRDLGDERAARAAVGAGAEPRRTGPADPAVRDDRRVGAADGPAAAGNVARGAGRRHP